MIIASDDRWDANGGDECVTLSTVGDELSAVDVIARLLQ